MNAEVTPQKEFLTLNEASDYSRLSKVFLYLKRKEGELPAFKVGKKVLIKKTDLDAFINAKMEAANV